MESHQDFLRSIEDNENGHFLLENEGGRAILRVFPAGKKGRPVKKIDVQARLELFGVQDYDRAALDEAVAAASGEAFDIAAWEELPSEDARLELDMAEDESQAMITVVAPRHGGNWPGREEILTLLASRGVVAGIDEALVEAIANRSLPELANRGFQKKAYRIATMKNPTAARDASVQWQIEPNPRAVPVREAGQREEDPVDFRNLNVVQTCKAGDLLARVLPGEPGEAGFTVTGRTLPATDGSAIVLEAGLNVEARGTEFFSKIDGHARVSNYQTRFPRIDVEEILELDNVDYSTGHIDFPGTVVVHNTVLDGFQVNARGDIIIEKTVSNVFLKAEGDIILTGGAVTRNSGYVEAAGSIFARFAQKSSLLAGHGIYIQEVSMHSRLTAGQEIIVEEGRGEIIGGDILAGQRVKARKLGTKMETATRITVGVDPDTFQKLREMDAQYEEQKKTYHRVLLHMQQIEESRKRGKATAEDEETEKRLRMVQQKLEKHLENLELQRERLIASINPVEGAEIEVREQVFPGVEISFGVGVRKYRVERRSLPGARFSLYEDQVRLASL
ncbi:MAG: FapA family protein [Leptospiraceae bacterium]